MINPFAPLYHSCNHGTSKGKYDTLPDEPTHIDIEPVGVCNFRCRMCPTGLLALGRPGGFMSQETYTNILEKTTGAIRMIGWGEPLMHPKIIEFIEQANRLTHLNTNGSLMTPDLANRLCKAGLSSIKFSFQGTDPKTYEMMRGQDFFEGLLEAIEMVKTARGDSPFPFIAASTTTTDETPEMIEAFRERISPLVDDLTIGLTIFEFIDFDAVPEKHRDRLLEAKENARVVKNHPVPCPEVFDKLSIHWDGSVHVCCNDYSNVTDCGNINDNDLQEIWRHPVLEKYRATLAENDYSLPLCRDCYDYHELTDGA